ncbi:3-hydroxyacyl-CoA dehydrogenase [Edaphobacter sp. 4G125]|nr:3-hydroxyacyl-CoA dehydrogenase [Edaphobacter sp. 4G125]
MACSAAGFYVVLEDVLPSNLRKAEVEYSDLSQRGGFGALELASTVEDAVREADIAIDFVPDELESKLEIFSMIDRMAPPKTILCTPSTALSITDLASCVYRPERCVALRGEVARGEVVQVVYPPTVDRGVLETVEEMLQCLGALPVLMADPEDSVLTKNMA